MTDAKHGSVLWNSTKVASNNTVAIEYAGVALQARQRVVWHVTVWDGAGCPCAGNESASGSWEMGLLGASDWAGAEWIVASNNSAMPNSSCAFYHQPPAPLMRKQAAFVSTAPVVRCPSAVCRRGAWVSQPR